jgi:hypothetical protein
MNSPTLRNNISGWVGMKVTVGASPLAVTSLGRICVANNALTHLVKLVNVSDGSDVPGASVSVNMAGCSPDQFVYGGINLTNLRAGGSYYLVSQETIGGDQWYDSGTVSTTNAALVNSAVYFVDGIWNSSGSPNSAFGPASFAYTVGAQYPLSTSVFPAGSGGVAANPFSASGHYTAGTPVQLTAIPASGCVFTNWTGTITGSANPQTVTMSTAQTATANFQCSGSSGPASFLTGYALNGPPLRNNFTGWAGLKFTVGASPVTVASLGRVCVANNTMVHAVKLVAASTGLDVPNASVFVNMAGCTAGQFVYGAVNPITLSAGTSYYVVSQETTGGDQWYDSGTVSATTAATVNSAVYFFNGVWNSYGSPNTSFVPANFQYQ